MSIQTGRHLLALDHLRFFAASLVVAHHFSGFPDPASATNVMERIGTAWIRWGSTGVSLFLVLSGFLFVVICKDRQPDYWKFLANRALRIFPMLFVIMLLLMTASRAEWSPIDLLRFVTLQVNTGNPTTGWGNDILPFGPIWTIGVEFQFYLLFPLLLLILRRQGVKPLIMMTVAIIVFRALLVARLGDGVYYNAYHTLLGRLDQFLIGMLAGMLWLRRPDWFTRRVGAGLVLVSLLGLSCYLAAFKPSHLTTAIGFTVEGLLWSAFLVGYAAAVRGEGRVVRALAALGDPTYSVYLLHLFVGGYVLHKARSEGWATGSLWIDVPVFAYLPTLLISTLTYHGIEKPFLSLRLNYLPPKVEPIARSTISPIPRTTSSTQSR